MSNRTISETTKTLIQARKLIEKPENWCQESLVNDRFGNSLDDVQHKNAYAFCVYGALFKVKNITPTNYGRGRDITKEVVIIRGQIPSDIADYNNHHSHADVLGMFDRAIQMSVLEDQKMS